MQSPHTLSLRHKHIVLRAAVGLALGFCVLLLCLLRVPLMLQADRHIYDLFLRWSAGGVPAAAPAIVDIDEASLMQYGQWPWPRHLLATLTKKLTEAGAAAIGFDILFAETDRTSPLHLRQSLREHFGVDVTVSGLPDYLHDNDALFAHVLRQSPSVLGIFLRFGTIHNSTELNTALPVSEGVVERMPVNAPPAREKIFAAHEATLPLPVLRDTAPVGIINVAPDADGIVRAVPLLGLWQGRVLPSLPVRVLMRGLGIRTLILEGNADGLAAVRMGAYTVPVTPQGLFLTPFRGGRRTYPYFSAMDILQDRIPKEELQGRLLFVGTSAAGLLDIRASPLDAILPGVEIHAAVLDSILSKRALIHPAWAPGAQVLAITAACIIVTLLLSLAAPVVYLPITGILLAGSVGGAWQLFVQGYFFSPLYSIVCVLTLAVGILIIRFWQETSQRRRLRQSFMRYVAPDMVDRIVERGEAVLSGEEREATLMFTDIRGFTSLSEKLTPDQVVAMLNRYFTPMTAIIRKSGGTVDKFIGDAIMAFWNAPLDVPQHEFHAVQCALHMQAALKALNNDLQAELGLTLRMGVGVHTGKVYVGNMGSAELLDYTCIGDTVNLASRLEGQCSVYGVEIILSEATAHRVAHCHNIQELDAPVCIHLDDIRVKGKATPVGIYTALAPADYAATAQEWQQYAAARSLYVDGNFTHAAAAFEALLAAQPHSTLYALYAQRCQTLCTPAAEPLPAWDGVWTMQTK